MCDCQSDIGRSYTEAGSRCQCSFPFCGSVYTRRHYSAPRQIFQKDFFQLIAKRSPRKDREDPGSLSGFYNSFCMLDLPASYLPHLDTLHD